jgi:hypothetical protein
VGIWALQNAQKRIQNLPEGIERNEWNSQCLERREELWH